MCFKSSVVTFDLYCNLQIRCENSFGGTQAEMATSQYTTFPVGTALKCNAGGEKKKLSHNLFLADWKCWACVLLNWGKCLCTKCEIKNCNRCAELNSMN